jgi:hypothetical protein
MQIKLWLRLRGISDKIRELSVVPHLHGFHQGYTNPVWDFQKQGEAVVREHENLHKLGMALRTFIGNPFFFLSPDPAYKRGFEGLVSNYQAHLFTTGGMVNVLNVLVDPTTGRPLSPASQPITPTGVTEPPVKESRLSWNHIFVMVLFVIFGILAYQRVAVSSVTQYINGTVTPVSNQTEYGSIMPPQFLALLAVGA